ncbi:MAG: restriction endonuclease subunit S [Treponemataceae bacterium]
MDNRHYEKFSDGRVKDIEDEIPFAVPEGWAWCRLRDIVTYIDDGDWIESKEQSDFGIRLLQTGNIGCGHFKDKEGNYHYISEETFKKLNCNEIYPGDILISRLPEPVGRACIVPNLSQRLITAVDCAIIRLKQDIISKNYFIYYTQSAKYLELIKNNCMGTTRLRISRANLEKTLIPLPPLSEQHRIVAKIERIFAQIDLLEQNKADLQTAVKQAKSKILDLAIHGKLVPQDPADEPASVMLEKLRAEKEAKIALGEIKRGKKDSYIYKNSTHSCYYQKFDDGTEEQIEIPFNLPESWCWQKISSICEINPKNKLDNTLEISFVPMTLIDSEFNSNFTYELQRWETVKSGFSHFSDNDIGIAKITPCFENRKSVIFKNLKNKYGAGTTELHILRTNNKYIFNEYVFWFIKTDTFIKEGINNFTGAVGQQRIGKEFIAETLIPIPPLNEQVKICRTINKLMKKLDKISLNIV